MYDDTRPAPAPAQKPPAQACLEPLLNALSWTGGQRRLFEALPEGQSVPDLPALLGVLGNLRFHAVPFTSKRAELGDEALPALLACEDGDVWVIVEIEKPRHYKVFKGRLGRLATVSADELAGRIFLVYPAESRTVHDAQSHSSWLGFLFDNEQGLMRKLPAASILIACLALALPVYAMMFLDLAVGGGSARAMTALAGGMVLIISIEMIIREIRASMIAGFAVRCHKRIVEAALARIAHLPLVAIEAASASKLINRLRSFEAIRDISAAPLAAALLDLPFIGLFIITGFIIDGWLGWLVAGLAVLLAGLSVLCAIRMRTVSHKAQIIRMETGLFRKDMTGHLPVIQSCQAEDIWERRYGRLLSRGIAAETRMRRIVDTNVTMAQAATALTAVLIIGFGAYGVMEGALSIGALVALSVIAWRIFIPVQSLILSMDAVFQALDVGRQFGRLMRLPQEKTHSTTLSYEEISGRIKLENTGYHRKGADLPLLRNITMTVDPGELVALTGPSASTRSALLRLIVSLYQPDSGRITIDGFDARQFDVRQLRQRIALVSEDQCLFLGSLAYNLRLVNPFADEDLIRAAIRDADLDEFVGELDEGIETDLSDRLRVGLDAAIRRKFRLARAYVQNPAVYLFDEPSRDLDAAGRRAFISKLIELKGGRTAIVGTSDDDILSLADKVAYLKGGQLVKLDVQPPDLAGSKAKSLRSLLEKRQTASPKKRSASA